MATATATVSVRNVDAATKAKIAALLAEAGIDVRMAGEIDPARAQAASDIAGWVDVGEIVKLFPANAAEARIVVSADGSVSVTFPGGNGGPKASPTRVKVMMPDGRVFDGVNPAIHALYPNGLLGYKSKSFSTEAGKKILASLVQGVRFVGNGK